MKRTLYALAMFRTFSGYPVPTANKTHLQSAHKDPPSGGRYYVGEGRYYVSNERSVDMYTLGLEYALNRPLL